MGTYQSSRGKEFGMHREVQPLRFGGPMLGLSRLISAGTSLSRRQKAPSRTLCSHLTPGPQFAFGGRESNFPSTPLEFIY